MTDLQMLLEQLEFLPATDRQAIRAHLAALPSGDIMAKNVSLVRAMLGRK